MLKVEIIISSHVQRSKKLNYSLNEDVTFRSPLESLCDGNGTTFERLHLRVALWENDIELRLSKTISV